MTQNTRKSKSFQAVFNPNQHQRPAPEELEIPDPAHRPYDEMPNDAKHWVKSKTMWFNIGVAALGVATTVLPVAQPFISARTYGMLTTGIAIGNMALRTITKKPIK